MSNQENKTNVALSNKFIDSVNNVASSLGVDIDNPDYIESTWFKLLDYAIINKKAVFDMKEMHKESCEKIGVLNENINMYKTQYNIRNEDICRLKNELNIFKKRKYEHDTDLSELKIIHDKIMLSIPTVVPTVVPTVSKRPKFNIHTGSKFDGKTTCELIISFLESKPTMEFSALDIIKNFNYIPKSTVAARVSTLASNGYIHKQMGQSTTNRGLIGYFSALK